MHSDLANDERLRLEAQHAEIAALAGALAHEIRNPLSTIGMNLELLVEELRASENPRDKRLLGKIEFVQRECGRLDEILKAFLQFVRVGEMDIREHDLNELVSDFIEFYRPQADEHEIELSPHLQSDLPRVAVDDSLMRQVLMNLALNAQAAMPAGGCLELQTSARDGRVQLDLIDTGSGMDEETLAKIFQAFFSTRKGGSGLGLPMARKIIEAHGGTITCESEPGRGTRFTISLPAVA